MTCPARDTKAPRYTCWQRIPQIADRREILLCQQCPYGRALMATVATMSEFDPHSAVNVEAVAQLSASTKQEMIMNDKTYTMPELAGLIGVPVKVVSNAKYSKSTPRPGSNIHLVIEKMKEMGITWDHIVSAPKGGYKGHRKTPTVDASRAAPEPDLVPEAISPPLVKRVSAPTRPAEQSESEINDDEDCCSAEDLNDQNDGDCESVDRPIHL